MKLITLFFFLFFFTCLKAQNDYIDYEKDVDWIQQLDSIQGAENTFNTGFDSKNFNKNLSFIDISYHPSIGNNIERYLSYKWFSKVIGLFEYYRPLFESKLESYGLPLELAFLPIVESNLNPQAKSPVGAEGLWQFMPSTGKEYGLAKSTNINLFFDPYMSTDSACRFLSYLYRELNDWNLVLSAYNCGLGRVRQAIKKAGTTEYWKVRQYLPTETQAYVPTFHAIKYLHHNYHLYYKSLPTLKYSFSDTKEITIKQTTTFHQLAKEFKMNLQTLYFLNPHLTSEVIPKNSFVYIL